MKRLQNTKLQKKVLMGKFKLRQLILMKLKKKKYLSRSQRKLMKLK